jgi:hypothetical protein
VTSSIDEHFQIDKPHNLLVKAVFGGRMSTAGGAQGEDVHH